MFGKTFKFIHPNVNFRSKNLIILIIRFLQLKLQSNISC